MHYAYTAHIHHQAKLINKSDSESRSTSAGDVRKQGMEELGGYAPQVASSGIVIRGERSDVL